MGLFAFFEKNTSYSVPRGYTPKEYASKLLDEMMEYVNDINIATDVFDFTYSYKKIKELSEKLIWLNERKHAFMYPSPRSELDKINKNIAATIDAFISRALATIRSADEERAEDLESLIYDIEHDGILSSILAPSNRERIAQISKEATNLKVTTTLRKIGIESFLDCADFDAFAVIHAMEQHIQALYGKYILDGDSPENGKQAFENFKFACETSSLPLAAEVRLESLLSEYKSKFSKQNTLYEVDHLAGHDFEYWCASLLKKLGFTDVEVTPGSGDQGVDILAKKDSVKYAVQCKCYSSDLGNTPVQEVHAGKAMYGCHVGAVMTNRHFTAGGRQLAEATGVLLWDRDWIADALRQISETK